MALLRIASYNIEWMDGLFDREGALALDDKWSGRRDVTRLAQGQAINTVLRMVDADIYLILEGPNEFRKRACKHQLERFARHYGLRTNRAQSGFPSGTDQEIALLFDPKKVSVRFTPRNSKSAPRFDKEITTTIAGHEGTYRFSKPPLETKIRFLANNFTFRLIGCHFKTKAPHGAKNDVEAVQIGFENRRKQIAQARWLKRRIECVRSPLIVAGDLNDGPGYDEYEQILGESTVNILVDDGRLYDPSLERAAKLSSARFFNREDHSYKEALLDFVLVNPALRPFAKKWRIWHPINDAGIAQIEKWQEALLTASDHFPVSLDLEFSEN